MLKRITTLLIFIFSVGSLIAQNQQDLFHLASYSSNMADAAEVVAYDPSSQHVFFTSNGANTLTILELSDPSNPTLFLDVDLSSYGGGPNSVAVANGLVAVAVENEVKTDPGSVLFFDTDGTFITSVQVGALPDMVAFSPDFSKVLTADEGVR
ncbi:MAG: hypothetical protein R2792_19595 [Saprospiraceae bacterium]